MFMGNREHSAGGPFFKDIDFQSSTGVIEMYNVIFSGHTQTETYRQGLHTYAMQVTPGVAPTTPDYAWLDAVKDANGKSLITGFVPTTGRGTLAGTASGNVAGHDTTVGLSNATEQYFVRADASGNYSIANALPGTYTMTMYDNELEVGTKTIVVKAGATTTANIVNAFYLPSTPIFRIGTFDGTPQGFLNADRIETEHPSDVRMNSWTSLPNFVVGTNTDAQFAMAEFMGVNNGQRITFNLTSAQVQNLTLRIGITLGFEGARPKVTVNTNKWVSGNPTATRDLNSRGVTRGTWRGDNTLYTFAIPSTAFVVGTNTIDLPMISGSYVAGQTWLSPNAVFDAIDLVPTTLASPPTIASVTVTPANSTVAANGSKAYAAIAKGATGATLIANLNFTATRGTLDASGNYAAPTAGGSDAVVAVATLTRTPGYATGTGNSSTISASVTATGSTALTVVAAPTGATATAGNAQVTIAFAAAAGAASYSIKRATSAAGTFTTIATGLTTTSYTDATAANGTTYFYVVTAVNGATSVDSAQVSATPVAPLAPAPILTSFVVNDGNAQRSMITSLTLNFDKAVTLGATAISLLTQDGSAVGFVFSPASGSSAQYVLTFPDGTGGSLGDGVYTLSVDGSAVTAAGSAQMTGKSSFSLHRLFGDVNGDRTVNSIDNFQFRNAFGTSSGGTGFNAAFDYNGDGVVNSIDNFQFRARFGVTI